MEKLGILFGDIPPVKKGWQIYIWRLYFRFWQKKIHDDDAAATAAADDDNGDDDEYGNDGG